MRSNEMALVNESPGGSGPHIEVFPATADRWADLEALFGEHGASGGCWCMFWRMARAEFNRSTGEDRKAALKEMTLAGKVPGVLAYAGGQIAGWCSIGPRESYSALVKSRILKPIDQEPVWSIVCFYVAKAHRRSGMLVALLRGAVDYAGQQGARIVEGYPTDLQTPKLAGQKLKGDSGYMGIASAFRAAGFSEVGRASETQLIMRYALAAPGPDPT